MSQNTHSKQVAGATAEGNKDEWIKSMVQGKVDRINSYQGGLQVIGAGLPRTGTSSMQAALEILLGEPGYHMKNVIGEDKVNFWRDMNKGIVSIAEIKEHFKEYAAV